ncbi:hypothetical protein AX15_002991 [Amanita polypyramis BW_CC]|nr:hypothetical protein AX15_002991 [Amanita polypyramis BW_CC]
MDMLQVPTPLFPASPTSRMAQSYHQSFGLDMPLTPEASPTVAEPHYASFSLGQPRPATATATTTTTTATATATATPTSAPANAKGRTIILCFDGTGNKFGEENSNVVRFFRALVKNKRKDQLVYYQPGIGTYNKRAFITRTITALASKFDAAVALHLDDHVKDGYKYIIQSYCPGDKICLFGFSRGAHTARVVAGMLYKVGIIPKENMEQVDFAFSVYSTTGYEGYKLSREFKNTFASPVSVEFVGVWDTVSSVGIIPRVHPYTSINYAVKTFRHALALDERRARFRPNVWSEATPAREQELDVDLLEPDCDGLDATQGRDDWQYKAPNRDFADVKEVWFAGCHADVGGGSHSTKRNQSLSAIPLRWMIKECILAKTGILFDWEYLKEDLEFDFHGLIEEMKEKNIKLEDLGEDHKIIEQYGSESPHQHPVEHSVMSPSHSVQNRSRRDIIRRHIHDVCDAIFDQLALFWVWWLLEILPMLCTYQDTKGDWIRRRMRNFGRGRYIPFYQDEIQIHESVLSRIEETKRRGGSKVYVPKAHNWEQVSKSPMLKYVK